MYDNNDRWWLRCSAVRRYMPGEDGKSAADIAAELDAVVECGYQAIHITAPYASAGFWPWWGLRPKDYFSPNETLCDTMEEFRELVRLCHARGLKVIVFLNIGYADVTSDLWKKACFDKRAGIDSPECRFFLWSDSGAALPMQSANDHFRQGGRWQWSDDARMYYWCYWNEGGFAEPQYNWASADYQLFARRVLNHWLATGIDGVIVDAVNWYLNCDWRTIRNCVTDVIHFYPNVMCIPEGGTGFGDSFPPWVFDGGFDVVDDQTFHSDLHWGGSAIMEAIQNCNPDLLDQRLAVCREMRMAGRACWSYLSWGQAWTPQFRLLEIALLIATGHMTEIIPSYLMGFQPEHWALLRGILQASRCEALAPIGQRMRIFPHGSAACYACLCPTGLAPVLCAFNLSNERQELWIDLPADGHPWRELLLNYYVSAENGLLRLELPPYGFCFLQKVI